MGDTGRALFAVVEEYAALGDHRTGTTVDEATIEWMASKLRNMGAAVTVDPFDFDRYRVDWELQVDDERIESIPLFYEGVGVVRTTSPAITTSRVVGGAAVPDFDREAPALARVAEAAIVGTDVAGGHLCAANRRPVLGSGLPTLCVAMRDIDRVRAGKVELSMTAEIGPGRSANVLAHLGDGPREAAVLLATPLSGWFRCAGERGTGIAVCLEVARQLAESGPVTVLATDGHELSGLGIHHHLSTRQVIEPAIFHFGASVASGDADAVRPPTRRAQTVRATAWAGEARRSDLHAALAPLGLEVRLPNDEEAALPGTWIGEAVVWAPLRRLLVSIAGGFPLHHVPLDVPELATTPTLLEESLQAAVAAARILADAVNEMSRP